MQIAINSFVFVPLIDVVVLTIVPMAKGLKKVRRCDPDSKMTDGIDVAALEAPQT